MMVIVMVRYLIIKLYFLFFAYIRLCLLTCVLVLLIIRRGPLNHPGWLYQLNPPALLCHARQFCDNLLPDLGRVHMIYHPLKCEVELAIFERQPFARVGSHEAAVLWDVFLGKEVRCHVRPNKGRVGKVACHLKGPKAAAATHVNHLDTAL